MDLGRRCVEFSPPFPLPTSMLSVVESFVDAGLVRADLKQGCDYLAINEYKAPGGIESHVDRYTDSEQILILSLLEDCVMELSYQGDIRKSDASRPAASTSPMERAPLRLLLPRLSLLVMRDEARWAWAHGISFGNVHEFDDHLSVTRDHRLSLTFLLHPDGVE
eukprot:CAMPEP_0180507320 /NCGR_PEP_ID=MMETSP1036_2-20121128/48522_1 /TAXON_ID=632150 /ORGANISM="Azadinium spinosum, Strain 3D9" /LENGTH=163 /DNA_ID=CAMNT_0022517445 /DNA_START=110 /DNA_END=601 /DNA_ORIENTATION=+